MRVSASNTMALLVNKVMLQNILFKKNQISKQPEALQSKMHQKVPIPQRSCREDQNACLHRHESEVTLKTETFKRRKVFKQNRITEKESIEISWISQKNLQIEIGIEKFVNFITFGWISSHHERMGQGHGRKLKNQYQQR